MSAPAAEAQGMAGSDEETAEALAERVRAQLRTVAGQGAPITYKALANALGLTPPNTVHRVTQALETLMAEDAAAGRPMIAALVVARARGGLPAPGFFDCAARLGRFSGNASEAAAFHAAELEAAAEFWRTGAPTPRSQGQ